jgi:dTDP-4-dehydrorhamnose reductase
MKIAVTGANGMLGEALLKCLSGLHNISATSRNKGLERKNIEWDCFDLTNFSLLKRWLNNVKPDIVIHCAANINVDLCEDNASLAIQIHVKTTEILSIYADENDIRMIYISSDQVFNGEKKGTYKESDKVNPLNVYAKTKLMGEKLVQAIDSGLVLRVNIIGWTKEGKSSFAEWILNGLIEGTTLNLFYDVHFSPLFVNDLSHIIEKIITNPLFGIYHCASRDSISKCDFGKKLAEIFKLSESNINRVSLDSFSFKAIRPKNMALDVKKISDALNFDLPSVEDSIRSMHHHYNK